MNVRTSDRVFRWLFVAVAIVATVNVLLYAGRATIPLVQGDAWTSLLGWLGRDLDGDLRLLDLLVQPTRDTTNLLFQKLLVLAHVRWLGLDFSIEGPVTALSALALAALSIWRMAGVDVVRWRARDAIAAAGVVLLATTLASTNIYTWGLAGLWFTWLAMAVAAYLWVARDATGAASASVAGALVGLAVDEMALVVLLPATLIAVTLGAGAQWRAKWPALAGFAAGILATQALYAWANHAAQLPTADDVQGGWGVLVSPSFLWAAATAPLGEVLLPMAHRERLLGGLAPLAGAALVPLALLLHTAVWGRIAWQWRRGALTPALALAAFLMLVSYAMVVGIGHQRVAQFGVEYLQQPRYLVFYVLQPIAAVIVMHEALPATLRYGRAVATAALLALALLQVAHALHAWAHLKFLSVYLQHAAQVFGKLDADPANVPADCPDIFSVCQMDEASRALVMRRLRDAGANLHDPDFRARHRLSMAAPCPQEATR